jgi:serine/threonine-protein kinase
MCLTIAGVALAAAPGPQVPITAPPPPPAGTVPPPPPAVTSPPPPPANGELVAVAVGDSCTFSVNGATKNTGTQLKLSVPPGAYTVVCKFVSDGLRRSRSVVVKAGEPAMAMFKHP